jgi:hypothetical protein
VSDAADTMFPFMGQDLNTGLEDLFGLDKQLKEGGEQVIQNPVQPRFCVFLLVIKIKLRPLALTVILIFNFISSGL